jgi:hypothetical protein
MRAVVAAPARARLAGLRVLRKRRARPRAWLTGCSHLSIAMKRSVSGEGLIGLVDVRPDFDPIQVAALQPLLRRVPPQQDDGGDSEREADPVRDIAELIADRTKPEEKDERGCHHEATEPPLLAARRVRTLLDGSVAVNHVPVERSLARRADVDCGRADVTHERPSIVVICDLLHGRELRRRSRLPAVQIGRLVPFVSPAEVRLQNLAALPSLRRKRDGGEATDAAVVVDAQSLEMIPPASGNLNRAVRQLSPQHVVELLREAGRRGRGGGASGAR